MQRFSKVTATGLVLVKLQMQCICYLKAEVLRWVKKQQQQHNKEDDDDDDRERTRNI